MLILKKWSVLNVRSYFTHVDMEKLAIICKHPDKAILISHIETDDVRDSGNLYACPSCANKPEEMWNIEDWQTMCEGCVVGHDHD